MSLTEVFCEKIEHLQTKGSESRNKFNGNNTDNRNKSIEQISSRITELTTFKENINGAKSLDDLKQIISSYCGIPGREEIVMHHKGYGRCGYHMDRHVRIQVNTTNSSANGTTYSSTV
jgi:hypothetical protein